MPRLSLSYRKQAAGRMPRLSLSHRKQAVHMIVEGASVKDIVQHLGSGGVKVCRQTVWRLIKHYNQHNKCSPLKRSGKRKVLSPRKLNVIEENMQADDESTGKELKKKLFEATGENVSLRSIYRERRELGWSCIPWCCLLSTHQGRKQTETFTVGSTISWRPIRRCHLDWWDKCAAWNASTLLLSQKWPETTKQA